MRLTGANTVHLRLVTEDRVKIQLEESRGPQGPAGPAGAAGADGADGRDGYSPKISVVPITGGHRVTITDASGTKFFDVMDGAGSDGSGASGKDGFSPVVDVIAITGGHRVNITDSAGTKTFNVLNGEAGSQGPAGPQGTRGESGPQGPAGANGETPVRGRDYWTAADIAEIKSYVDDAILNGAW